MKDRVLIVEAIIPAPREKVWDFYTLPEHIVQWNFADATWHCPSAENDLTVGGTYAARMEAKDGSFGFDFVATYREIELGERLRYTIADGRDVEVVMTALDDGRTKVTVTFEPEGENPEHLQQQGWQAILDNFAKYVLTK